MGKLLANNIIIAWAVLKFKSSYKFLCTTEQGCGHALVVCRGHAHALKAAIMWLQFWRMLLLTSGDVETNPGPAYMTTKQIDKVANGQLGN